MRARPSVLRATFLIGAVSLVAACDSDRTTRTSQASPVYSPAYNAPSGQTTARSFGSMRASDLIGKNVYTTNGDRVGEIDDIVMNRSNRATAAVVGVGGFLGVGEKKAVVPINQLAWQGDRIVAPNATKESIQRATAYQDRDWYPFDRSRTLGP